MDKYEPLLVAFALSLFMIYLIVIETRELMEAFRSSEEEYEKEDE